MAAPRPWTKDDDEQLTALHAEGKSLHSIAGQMGRAKRTISEHARVLGLTWDRSRTAAATKARVIDAKQRRVDLATELLNDVARLRAQLWTETEYVDHGGKDFTQVKWRTPEPVFADKLKIMQSVGIGVEKHLRLVAYDSGSTEQVRSLLEGFAQQLGLARDDDPPAS